MSTTSLTDLQPEINTPNTDGSIDPTPLTGNGLHFLARHNFLSPENFEKAMLFLGLRPQNKDWSIYWLKILLTTGLLFCVAGIICFFAFNWAVMPHLLKFGIIIALIIICGALSLWRGPDSLTGGLSLLACGLLAGPLLAVYGQYYQTGADAWELFRAWSFFLFLLALFGRQNGLWLATWIVASLWAVLGMYQLYFIADWHYSVLDMLHFGPFLLGQLIVLVVWEAFIWRARKQPESFLHAAWSARIVACVLLFVLTWEAMQTIITLNSWRHDDFMPGSPLIPALLYLIFMVTGFFWYRRKRPDTLILTFMMFSLIVLLYTFMFTFLDFFSAGGMLFAAVLLIGLAFGVTRLALHWHRKALRLGLKTYTETAKHKPWVKLLFLRPVSVKQLFAHLNLNNLNEAETTLETNLAHLEPWYIKLILTICAWVAAIFLIVFMGFVIFEIATDGAESLFTFFAIIFIGLGAFMVSRQLVFARQFGLALALAGALVLPVSLAFVFEMESFWQIPIFFTAVICFIFVKHPAMRALAFFGIFMCCLDLILVFFNYTDNQPRDYYENTVLSFYYLKLLVLTVIFAITACFMLNAWIKEKLWVQVKFKDGIIQPALTGFIAIFAFMGLFSAFFNGHSWHNTLEIWDIYHRMIYLTIASTGAGIGSAIGLFFMAIKLSINRANISQLHKLLIYSGCLICLIASWWLPWLAVGLLFLAISRYIGNLALTGLSIFYLVVCLGWFYGSLQISLLYKSYNLLTAGIIMLIAGFVIYRVFYTPEIKKGASHA